MNSTVVKLISPLFWNCNCTEGYVYPNSSAACKRCGAARDDQPNSFVEDLAGLNEDESFLARLDTRECFEVWKYSDNVVIYEKGYLTQCTQYRYTFSEDELYLYFVKEFL